MSNIVYYFSGTGNSLAVARDLAHKLGETRIVPVADAIKESAVELPYERIGFVFPVYYVSVPPIMKKFLAKLNFNKSQYIFGVITYGAIYGPVFTQLSNCIAERGGVLCAGFPVQMPGNHISLYNAWPAAIQHILLKRGKQRAESIAEAVKTKNAARIPKGNIVVRLSKVSIDSMKNYHHYANKYHVTEKCAGCGTCKRICPADNIQLGENKPVWGEYCERCVACIQWCPTKAIEYADKTSKRNQYRHPEVKISDFLKP